MATLRVLRQNGRSNPAPIMISSKKSVAIVSTLIICFGAVAYFHSFHTTSTETTRSTIGKLNGKGDESNIERDDKDENEDDLFCAVFNPLSGTYIDLSQLSSTPNKPLVADGKKGSNTGSTKNPPKSRWMIRGWDYDTNFTLGICSSPVTAQEEPQLDNHTGGFYTDPKDESKLVSIGDFATKPKVSGNRKLTLQYHNGSMCPNKVDRKSTLLYFVCDKEISAKAQMTYIGNLHECSYFFEVRSIYACPTTNKSKEVNVLGIFVGIFAVFFIVEYGGRRWLYGKMKTHFNSSGLASSSSGLSSLSPSQGLNLSNERSFRPRWEYIEREPKWKSIFKTLGNLLTTGLRAPRKYVKPTLGAGGPIRLSSQSTRGHDSFLQDMEQQNNILDSLEVATSDSNSTIDSTTRRLD